MIPEKLIQYAAETSALIHVLWALALIFFIALVNVSLMLGIAWMKEHASKDRERRFRARLGERDRRVAELELAIQRMAELGPLGQTSLARPPGPPTPTKANPAAVPNGEGVDRMAKAKAKGAAALRVA